MGEPIVTANAVKRGEGEVRLSAVPDGPRWSLRAKSDDLGRLEAAWGAPLPLIPLSSASAGDRHALRLGPDEWLLLADADCAADGLALLPPSPPFSLVNVSDRHVAWTLAGLRAADVITACCPLDLSDAAFAAGGATRTVFGKAEILLWRQGLEASWRIETSRSFTDYVTRQLARSIADI